MNDHLADCEYISAVREDVINAFVQQQIESRQAVEITIYKSFIDISSPGLFPQNLEPEDLIRGFIKPPRRNPLITSTLYYSRDMEGAATGFKRISADCTKAGVKFEFKKEPYGFTVRFHRHCGEGWDQTQDQDVSGTRPEKRPDQQAEIEERSNRVLELLIHDPTISRPAICEKLHLLMCVRMKINDIRLKSAKRAYFAHMYIETKSICYCLEPVHDANNDAFRSVFKKRIRSLSYHATRYDMVRIRKDSIV